MTSIQAYPSCGLLDGLAQAELCRITRHSRSHSTRHADL